MSRPTPPALRAVANTVGVLAFLVAAFPVYWMVNSSFLDRNEIRNPVPTWVPFGGDLDNFRTVFGTDQFVNALKTSLMVTGLTIVVALSFAFVAAVAVSRFRFRERSDLRAAFGLRRFAALVCWSPGLLVWPPLA